MVMHLIAYARLNEGYEYVYDYSTDESNLELIKKKSQELSNMTSDNEKSLYTVHFLTAEGSGFKAVKNMDPYFKNAQQVESLDEFVNVIQSNSQLTSIDVASYIERICPNIGSFALQKTLYYVYADWLKKYKNPLFSANFLAFARGPVDSDVYRIKTYNKEKLEKSNLFHVKIASRKERANIIELINNDVLKYADYYNEVWRIYKAEYDEFNLTHKEGTPWYRAYEKGQNSPILDSDIIKYHELECIY